MGSISTVATGTGFIMTTGSGLPTTTSAGTISRRLWSRRSSLLYHRNISTTYHQDITGYTTMTYHSNWQTWDERRHWDSYDWYQNERRDDTRRERYNYIQRDRQQRGAQSPQHQHAGASAAECPEAAKASVFKSSQSRIAKNKKTKRSKTPEARWPETAAKGKKNTGEINEMPGARCLKLHENGLAKSQLQRLLIMGSIIVQ